MKQATIYIPLLIILLQSLPTTGFAEGDQTAESPQVVNEPGATNELEGIEVIGNRELPKALVIVPWKAPEPGDLDGSPLQSLIDEVLGPVDKDVHKRKVSYYEQYY
ncbi:MAG: hypothetical protein AAF304_05130 [Pseudomonadota bacterium]